MAIWLTSDLHFSHDRDFIWRVRGYENVQHMNEEQIRKFNEKVQPEDAIYILGDLMLGDNAVGEECLKQLNGEKIIVLGNHDTSARIKIYEKYAEKIVYADMLKYKKRQFYLSHYPTMTANEGDTLGHCVINLFGHTHQAENFYNNNFNMYHVGVDSHDGYPVLLDDIIEEIKIKAKEGANEYETQTN